MFERRRSDLMQTADRFTAAVARSQERFEVELAGMAPRLSQTTSALAARRHALALFTSRMAHEGRTLLAGRKADLAADAAALDALSPLKVLARGYSITYGPSGVVTSASGVAAGDDIRVRLADGDVYAQVESVTVQTGAEAQND